MDIIKQKVWQLFLEADLSAAITTSQIQETCKLLGNKWVKLAEELKIDVEDLEYYKSEEGTDEEKGEKCITVWMVRS